MSEDFLIAVEELCKKATPFLFCCSFWPAGCSPGLFILNCRLYWFFYDDARQLNTDIAITIKLTSCLN